MGLSSEVGCSGTVRGGKVDGALSGLGEVNGVGLRGCKMCESLIKVWRMMSDFVPGSRSC